MTFEKDLPLPVEKKRNAKEDMARLINLTHDLLKEQKRTNELLIDLIGVPPVPIASSGDSLTPEQFEAMDEGRL